MALILYRNQAHTLFIVGPFISYHSVYTAPPKRKKAPKMIKDQMIDLPHFLM